ncbi:hypothetical protein ABE10_11545 [Bacillus toyonensis]|nr:hypothetical protein [Bacillus toyonensis]
MVGGVQARGVHGRDRAVDRLGPVLPTGVPGEGHEVSGGPLLAVGEGDDLEVVELGAQTCRVWGGCLLGHHGNAQGSFSLQGEGLGWWGRAVGVSSAPVTSGPAPGKERWHGRI